LGIAALRAVRRWYRPVKVRLPSWRVLSLVRLDWSFTDRRVGSADARLPWFGFLVRVKPSSWAVSESGDDPAGRTTRGLSA